LASAYILVACGWLARGGAGDGDQRLFILVRALVLVQLGVGALNLALLAPVWLQVVHLLVADLLWIALVLLCAAQLAVRPVSTAPARGATPAASGDDVPLVLHLQRPDASLRDPRAGLPLEPAVRLARDTRVLLDGFAEGSVCRETLYEMFCEVAGLRLAQCVAAIAALSRACSVRLRELVRSRYDESVAERRLLDEAAMRSDAPLPFILGESVYRNMREPTHGHLRDVRLIHLARLRAGNVGRAAARVSVLASGSSPATASARRTAS
jgi:hypothetical protein